jgi:signal transduction histidine kinase
MAMIMTTIVTVTNSAGAQAAGAALRNAGLGVVEVETVQAAQAAMRESRDTIVVCDGQSLVAIGSKPIAGELPKDVRRVLSHELRTPLSAMAGWLHLLESGKLDEAGTRRAIEKLRGNIDDQVRTIERYLGANQEGHH